VAVAGGISSSDRRSDGSGDNRVLLMSYRARSRELCRMDAR
jgi:hypothetical protein